MQVRNQRHEGCVTGYPQEKSVEIKPRTRDGAPGKPPSAGKARNMCQGDDRENPEGGKQELGSF